MVDGETAQGETNRRNEMQAERDEEVEGELARVDEEMDPKETEQSDAATLPDEEEGEHERKDDRHVETNESNDSA
jgi:hypothetical protein